MPEPLEIPVEVETDEASRILDEFAADVEELQDKFQPVEVEVDTGDAVDDLDKVGDAAKELEDLDPEIEVGADVSKAKKGLDDVGKSAHGAGLDVGELRDLGGPLDEAFSGLSGTAGDFGEAFQIAGGKVGGALGLGEQAVGRLSTAMGIGGVALGAVLTFWNIFKQGAEDAKKATEEVMKTQQDLAAGQTAQAAAEIVKQLGTNTLTAAKALGVSTNTVIEFVTGATDKLGPLTDELARVKDAYYEALQNPALGRDAPVTRALFDQMNQLDATVGKVTDYRDTWIRANGTLQETKSAEFEVAQALDASTDELLSQARTVDGPTRAAILRHIALVNGIPESKMTEILTDTDPDDVAQTKKEIDRIADQPRTATISVRADTTRLTQQIASAVATVGGQVAAFGSAQTASNVQQYQARNGPLPG